MDHIVVPLDRAHADPVDRLADRLAEGWGTGARTPSSPHITLVSYDGLSLPAAADAVAPVAAATAPFTVRAHGYGLFSGSEPRELSLHVMVVRSRALDELQARVRRALASAGARIDGLTSPEAWTPHITLLDRCLTPTRVAQAVEDLARRPHCSWSVPVEALDLGHGPDGTSPRRLPLGAT